MLIKLIVIKSLYLINQTYFSCKGAKLGKQNNFRMNILNVNFENPNSLIV